MTASPRAGVANNPTFDSRRLGASTGGGAASAGSGTNWSRATAGGTNTPWNNLGRSNGFFSNGRPTAGRTGGADASSGVGRTITRSERGGDVGRSGALTADPSRGRGGDGRPGGGGRFSDRGDGGFSDRGHGPGGPGGPGRGPGGHGVDPDRFYGNMLDRRIEYPGVARPHAAGLVIGHHRPVFYHGHRVFARVPHCGFGFFTPVLVAAPVYPVPVYETPALVAAPAYYPPPVYAEPAPPPVAAEGGYGYETPGGYYGQPAYAGVAGQPPAGPAPGEPAQGGPEAMPQGGPDGMPPEAMGAQPNQQVTYGQPGQQGAPSPDPQVTYDTTQQAPPQDGQQAGEDPNRPPTEAERQIAEGMEAFSGGEYDKAGRIFLKVAMADKDNMDAWLAYSVARFATRDYEASALALRRAIRAFPDVVNSPVDLRERYGNPADFDKQVAAVEEYVRTKPESVDGWLVLGFARHFSGQRELASKTFDVVNRRFASDRDIADIFLKAKPLSEIMREATPPQQGGQNAAPPPAARSTGPAPITSEPQATPPEAAPLPPPPPPPPPPAGEQPSANPAGAALQAEQALRDSGLVDPEVD